MKTLAAGFALTVLIILASCKGADGKRASPASYTVQGSLATPRVFGDGSISTELPEFGMSFSPDGERAYFNRMPADRSAMFAVEARFADGKWQAAVPVTFVDSSARNVDLFVTPDGSEVLFSSTRATEAGKPKTDFDTWSVPRAPDGWGTAVHLAVPPNSPAQDVFVSATRTGTLYFASDRAGNNDIYRAARTAAGQYAEPERLSVVNTPASESNPLIAPDESFLIFVSERPEGVGGADLYVATRVHGTWTTPRNLGAPVNSPYADFAPGLSPDGKYLFFTSERPGVVKDSVAGRRPGDIWQVEIATIAAMKAS
jgi:Tol biopolymer transport system component